jgi:hypothetical protein
MTARDLYDHDFFEWTRCNAALLRAGDLDQADLEHIAEEIEDMGRSQQLELENRTRVLLSHLLKWRFQQQRRTRSWTATIAVQRAEVLRLLGMMPSLRRRLREALPDIYRIAVKQTISETDLPDNTFPLSCPFTVDEILDEAFLPE